MCVALPAQARVFSFKDNWVAAYFRGTAAQSVLGDDLYSKTSGNNTTFSDEVEYNFGGELGVAFLLSERLTTRVGIEGLQSKNITATGFQSGTATRYMDVESRAIAVSPNVNFEFIVQQWPTSRLYFMAGAGYSQVKVSNEYTLETPATTDYGGSQASYKETWVASGLSYTWALGWELHLLDNVTLNIDGGWRYMAWDELKYDADVTAVRGGLGTNLTKGSVVKDNSDQKVSVDLGGPFVGLTFKFYIPPLN